MKDYLHQKDLYIPLEGKTKKSSVSDENWALLDRKALATIRLCLAALVAFNIPEEKTTKDLMDTLKRLNENPSTLNTFFLMKRLYNMKMSEGGSITSHLNAFNTIVSQLALFKIKIEEEMRAIIFLYSLAEIPGRA